MKSKEVVSEVAQREMMIALRSGLYGVVLAGAIMAAMGTLACHHYSISSINDVRERIKSFSIPFGNSLIAYMKPYASWARDVTGKWQVIYNYQLLNY